MLLYEKEKIVETDVLVIGGGIAGCFAAIKAKEQGVDVVLADKGYVGKSGQTPNCNVTNVFVPEIHDLKKWMDQVHTRTEYMDNREWVEITFKESLDRWNDIASWGLTVFKWDAHGNVYEGSALSDDGEIIKEGGKGKIPRVSRKYVPRRNAEVLRKQTVKVGVNIMDRIMITDLIKQDGRVVGAIGFAAGTDNYEPYIFKAKAVVMAAGTAGLKADGIRCFSTGEADAMAYRIGCDVTGKEWNEGHPIRADFPAWPWSALDRDRFRTFKNDIYERRGAQNYNADGDPIEEFGEHRGMATIIEAHNGGAPIWRNIYASSSAYFVMGRSPKDMPRKEIDEIGSKRGRVRMTMGRALGQSSHVSDGIWPINTQCATQVEGLYAAGDCLGARAGGSIYPTPPGGFATAFCSVSGARAGTAAAEYSKQTKLEALNEEEVKRLLDITSEPLNRRGGFTPAWATQVLKNAMFPYWVLYVKHAERLELALKQVEYLRDNVVSRLTAYDPHELRLVHETKSLILNAEMKLKASLYRKESRGSHYREDYPQRDDPNWLAWIKIRDDNGEMKLTKEPIPEEWWPDLSMPYGDRYNVKFPI